MKKLLVALLFLSFGTFGDDKALAQSPSVQVKKALKIDRQSVMHQFNSDGEVVHPQSKPQVP